MLSQEKYCLKLYALNRQIEKTTEWTKYNYITNSYGAKEILNYLVLKKVLIIHILGNGD